MGDVIRFSHSMTCRLKLTGTQQSPAITGISSRHERKNWCVKQDSMFQALQISSQGKHFQPCTPEAGFPSRQGLLQQARIKKILGKILFSQVFFFAGTVAASSALLLFTSSSPLPAQETEGHSKAFQHLIIPRMMRPSTATSPVLSQGDCVRDTSMLLAFWGS